MVGKIFGLFAVLLLCFGGAVMAEEEDCDCGAIIMSWLWISFGTSSPEATYYENMTAEETNLYFGLPVLATSVERNGTDLEVSVVMNNETCPLDVSSLPLFVKAENQDGNFAIWPLENGFACIPLLPEEGDVWDVTLKILGVVDGELVEAPIQFLASGVRV